MGCVWPEWSARPWKPPRAVWLLSSGCVEPLCKDTEESTGLTVLETSVWLQCGRETGEGQGWTWGDE